MSTSVTRDLLAKSTAQLMLTSNGDLFHYAFDNTSQVELSMKDSIEKLEQKKTIEDAYAHVEQKTKTCLDPLWKELAEVVAKCHYTKSKNPCSQKLRKVEVHEMVLAIGSDELRLTWKEKQDLTGVSNKLRLKNYIRIVPPKQRVIFQEYRDSLLSGKGVHVPYTPKLSRKLKELGFFVAKSRLKVSDGKDDFITHLNTFISNKGSVQLQSFWKEKSSLATIQKYGFCHAIPPHLRAYFNDFCNEVQRILRNRAEIDRNVSHRFSIKDSSNTDLNHLDSTTHGIDHVAISPEQGNDISPFEQKNEPIYFKKLNQIKVHPSIIVNADSNATFMPLDQCMRCHLKQHGNESESPDQLVENEMVTSSQYESFSNTYPLSPEIWELARLLVQCNVTESFKVCNHCLAAKVSTSNCQALTGRWAGMMTLPRFQRDGYWMVIPASERESFRACVKYFLASRYQSPLQISSIGYLLDPTRASVP
jgi:hypothetical protein